jgi:sulfur-carrier protein adenylyltransferase/sulfurtransferase
MLFTSNERERYSRQILLPEFGERGQKSLKTARAMIIGAGGLGSPAALYLAAMGIGTLGIVDDDYVAISNLQRQILYRESDVGRRKTSVARERLSEINSSVTIQPVEARLRRENALDILRGFDLVLDGSDNFSTRYLVNDVCLVHDIPLISASILQFEGQLSVFCAPDGPCYRCLFPNASGSGNVLSCAEAGVIGALAGVMGTMMAMEAVKVIAKIGEPLVGRLMLYNALEGNFRSVRVKRDPACIMCSRPIDKRRLPESYETDTCLDAAWEMSWQEFERISMPLVDVREEQEFYEQPSRGKLIPLGLLLDRLDELPNEKFGIVCASGVRSLEAASLLRSKGFDAVSIRGGMNAVC